MFSLCLVSLVRVICWTPQFHMATVVDEINFFSYCYCCCRRLVIIIVVVDNAILDHFELFSELMLLIE